MLLEDPSLRVSTDEDTQQTILKGMGELHLEIVVNKLKNHHGVSVNTGSAADVRAGTEMLGLSDALTIRSNAAKEAYGQEVAATSDIAQANLDRAEGEQAETAGDIGAAGSLLSGASTAGGQYAKFSQG